MLFSERTRQIQTNSTYFCLPINFNVISAQFSLLSVNAFESVMILIFFPSQFGFMLVYSCGRIRPQTAFDSED